MIPERLPADVSEALERLSGNHDYRTVLRWLGDALDRSRAENDVLEGNALTRNQGACLTLGKILEASKGKP